MSMKFKVGGSTCTVFADIDVEKILRQHGLGSNGKAWKYAGARFKAYCDPYVPMQQGVLKNTAQVIASGKSCKIVYIQPYAHYQYYGKTMGPNVLTKLGWRSMASKGGKYYTGGSLSYHGAPTRGSYWDRRMLADKKQNLMNDIAAYVGGIAK